MASTCHDGHKMVSMWSFDVAYTNKYRVITTHTDVAIDLGPTNGIRLARPTGQ